MTQTRNFGQAQSLELEEATTGEDNMNADALSRQSKARFHSSKVSHSRVDRERHRQLPPVTLRESQQRQQATQKAQQGDYSEAIALLTQLIEADPSNALDYNNRGLLYFQSGQTEKAIADYNTAIHLNPQLDSAYNNRANYYASSGQLEQAIADYETALDLNPGNIRIWINQGITFRELRFYSRAIENFDLALILGERSHLAANIYAERGRTYHLWGDWNCAIADYYRALDQLCISGASPRYQQRVESWVSQLLNPISA